MSQGSRAPGGSRARGQFLQCPARKPVGDEGGALVLRNTVEHPHYVTADAGRDRLDLASKAGMLELALDTVETIQAENSLEKMLAHQLAAAYHSSMALTAQLNRCIENMEHYNSDG